VNTESLATWLIVIAGDTVDDCTGAPAATAAAGEEEIVSDFSSWFSPLLFFCAFAVRYHRLCV